MHDTPFSPETRLRRLRQTPALRTLLAAPLIEQRQLIYPIFVEEEVTEAQPIASMPGISRIPERELAREAKAIAQSGVGAVMLFGVSHHKDDHGGDSLKADGLLARMIRTIKEAAPELVVIADNCFCEYTQHGHCGVIAGGHVHNDRTLANLAAQALVCAEAGADMVAPSAMMDGQIGAMRQALDQSGYESLPIMAYSTKFASALYGPFRAAAGSTLKGDRKAYQMDWRNRGEAVRESLIDEAEGADILMVKPAGAYLDIIRDVREASLLPLAAYQVSGEYAMIKHAALAGAIDESRVVVETLQAIRRAGADLVLTYFARTFQKHMEAVYG